MTGVHIVPDNASPAELGPEPEGFWTPVHDEVAKWVKLYGQEDDGEPN